jgi:hypothetical protein
MLSLLFGDKYALLYRTYALLLYIGTTIRQSGSVRRIRAALSGMHHLPSFIALYILTVPIGALPGAMMFLSEIAIAIPF